jgi:hypothetical protein
MQIAAVTLHLLEKFGRPALILGELTRKFEYVLLVHIGPRGERLSNHLE